MLQVSMFPLKLSAIDKHCFLKAAGVNFQLFTDLSEAEKVIAHAVV
jgi:hypothetical protein